MLKLYVLVFRLLKFLPENNVSYLGLLLLPTIIIIIIISSSSSSSSSSIIDIIIFDNNIGKTFPH